MGMKKNAHAVALGRIGGRAKSEAKTAAVRLNAKKGGRPKKIQREYRDEDGYWIELMPGWQNGADPGTHAIHDDTKTAAHAQMGMVKRCACEECLCLLAQKTVT